MKVQLFTLIALSLVVINADPAANTYSDAASAAAQSLECYMYGDFQFFDFRNMWGNSSNHIVASTTSDKQYAFNFCSYAQNPCKDIPSEKGSYAYRFKSTPGNDAAQCMHLTDDEYLPD